MPEAARCWQRVCQGLCIFRCEAVTLPAGVAVFDCPASVFLDVRLVSNNFDFFSLFVSNQFGEDNTDQWCHSTARAQLNCVYGKYVGCVPGNNYYGHVGLLAVTVKVLETDI